MREAPYQNEAAMGTFMLGVISLALTVIAGFALVLAFLSFGAAQCEEGVDLACDPGAYALLGVGSLVVGLLTAPVAIICWFAFSHAIRRALRRRQPPPWPWA